MADWDADSSRLRQNLTALLRRLRDESARRPALDRETARRWHRDILYQLRAPLPFAVGNYRGEPGLENIEVTVGSRAGVPSTSVSEALALFEQRLQAGLAVLDADIAVNASLDRDQLAAVLDLCAWVHAEWVRIHPFANGNGRTARIWANCIALRYGLPPFLRLRPRPGGGYEAAGAAAMRGHWRASVPVFRKLLLDALRTP